MLVEGRRLRKVNGLVTDLSSGQEPPDVKNCKLIACVISGKLKELVRLLLIQSLVSSSSHPFRRRRRNLRRGSKSHRSKLEKFHGRAIWLVLEEVAQILRQKRSFWTFACSK